MSLSSHKEWKRAKKFNEGLKSAGIPPVPKSLMANPAPAQRPQRPQRAQPTQGAFIPGEVVGPTENNNQSLEEIMIKVTLTDGNIVKILEKLDKLEISMNNFINAFSGGW